MEVTYEQAKAAKETLIKYLEDVVSRRCEPLEDCHDEALALLALKQDYFLP